VKQKDALGLICLYLCMYCFRFGIKEEWMEFMNAFVSAEFNNMRKFLQNISVSNSTCVCILICFCVLQTTEKLTFQNISKPLRLLQGPSQAFIQKFGFGRCNWWFIWLHNAKNTAQKI